MLAILEYIGHLSYFMMEHLSNILYKIFKKEVSDYEYRQFVQLSLLLGVDISDVILLAFSYVNPDAYTIIKKGFQLEKEKISKFWEISKEVTENKAERTLICLMWKIRDFIEDYEYVRLTDSIHERSDRAWIVGMTHKVGFVELLKFVKNETKVLDELSMLKEKGFISKIDEIREKMNNAQIINIMKENSSEYVN